MNFNKLRKLFQSQFCLEILKTDINNYYEKGIPELSWI